MAEILLQVLTKHLQNEDIKNKEIYNMIKTEFIELYESLSKLNEATDFYASKRF